MYCLNKLYDVELMSTVHLALVHVFRLDLKTQQIDKGYPRHTDMTFGGVPVDAHDVFLYNG